MNKLQLGLYDDVLEGFNDCLERKFFYGSESDMNSDNEFLKRTKFCMNNITQWIEDRADSEDKILDDLDKLWKMYTLCDSFLKDKDSISSNVSRLYRILQSISDKL